MKELLTFDGFIPATGQLHKVSGKMKNRGIAEVVIALNSPLIGKSVKETKFRQRVFFFLPFEHKKKKIFLLLYVFSIMQLLLEFIEEGKELKEILVISFFKQEIL